MKPNQQPPNKPPNDYIRQQSHYSIHRQMQEPQKNPYEAKSPTLFVVNFPQNLPASELQDIFKPFGKILSRQIIYNPKKNNKPYAFVQFEDTRDAVAAQANLNNTIIQGRRLVIQFKTGISKKNRMPNSTDRPEWGPQYSARRAPEYHPKSPYQRPMAQTFSRMNEQDRFMRNNINQTKQFPKTEQKEQEKVRQMQKIIQQFDKDIEKPTNQKPLPKDNFENTDKNIQNDKIKLQQPKIEFTYRQNKPGSGFIDWNKVPSQHKKNRKHYRENSRSSSQSEDSYERSRKKKKKRRNYLKNMSPISSNSDQNQDQELRYYKRKYQEHERLKAARKSQQNTLPPNLRQRIKNSNDFIQQNKNRLNNPLLPPHFRQEPQIQQSQDWASKYELNNIKIRVAQLEKQNAMLQNKIKSHQYLLKVLGLNIPKQ